MVERLYGGYTTDEIHEKFYIHFNGEENRARLNDINGKLSKNWQIVAPKYIHAKTKLAEYKSELRRMEEQLKLDMDQTRLRLIKEDRGLPKNQRLSDKARETYAIGENFTEEVKEAFDKVHALIDEWEEEVMLWHEVRQNMRYVAERIKNAQISMAVEAKATRNYEDIPDRVDKYVGNKHFVGDNKPTDEELGVVQHGVTDCDTNDETEEEPF